MEINITYETLFDMLRKEKETLELQKLDEAFFKQVVEYLEEKSISLKDEKTDLFSYDDKKKIEIQMNNIRKILKELYEKRESKTIDLALTKSRTKSDVIDTSALLEEEKRLFDSLVNLFDKFRNGVLLNILNGKEPQLDEETNEIKSDEKLEESEDKDDSKSANELRKDTKILRFLHAVPKFVGKEMEEYGPFEENDIANIPTEIADVLISKERAEEIKES
jgi:DNA replication initiation complex subunit (GINS family)